MIFVFFYFEVQLELQGYATCTLTIQIKHIIHDEDENQLDNLGNSVFGNSKAQMLLEQSQAAVCGIKSVY